jgi:hypothetical protein
MAAYLAVKTWKLHDTVAEAKPIAVSIYNILMLVIVNAILYGVAQSNIISITVQVYVVDSSLLHCNVHKARTARDVTSGYVLLEALKNQCILLLATVPLLV